MHIHNGCSLILDCKFLCDFFKLHARLKEQVYIFSCKILYFLKPLYLTSHVNCKSCAAFFRSLKLSEVNKNERAHGKPASSFNEIFFFSGEVSGTCLVFLAFFRDTRYNIHCTLYVHYLNIIHTLRW
jgi:hypothetical protein